MRNIFDQYDGAENRLTHALACTLHKDPGLIHAFLTECIGLSDVPVENLSVVEQQLPGDAGNREANEAAGLPDLCIFNDDDWCVAFEHKIQAGLSREQLERHRATLVCRGYHDLKLVVISLDRAPDQICQAALCCKEWRDVYAWFRRRGLAHDLTEYMEILERQLIQGQQGIQGTLTMFDGIPFRPEYPYNHREAARLIRLLRRELCEYNAVALRELGADLTSSGIQRVVENEDGVWDFILLNDGRGKVPFTKRPHLTLSISPWYASAAFTIPNNAHKIRKRLGKRSCDEFCGMLIEISTRLLQLNNPERRVEPYMYALQRHYWPRNTAVKDARLEFDLRTIQPPAQSRVRRMPTWARTIHGVLGDEELAANIQIGVEARFPYPIANGVDLVEKFVASWTAMRPLIELVLPPQ